MKLRDEKEYEAWKDKQRCPGDPLAEGYGMAPFYRAERWADLMEERMAAEPDTPFEQIAKETERQAGRDAEEEDALDAGITGFQCGCVVAILARCWEHGEQLRRWHNLDTQISNEGERANECPGVVLNPAILNIERRD